MAKELPADRLAELDAANLELTRRLGESRAALKRVYRRGVKFTSDYEARIQPFLSLFQKQQIGVIAEQFIDEYRVGLGIEFEEVEHHA